MVLAGSNNNAVLELTCEVFVLWIDNTCDNNFKKNNIANNMLTKQHFYSVYIKFLIDFSVMILPNKQ